MKYALNIKKGTIINHPQVTIPGLVAVEVTDQIAMSLKNIINIIVFDKIQLFEEANRYKFPKEIKVTKDKPKDLNTETIKEQPKEVVPITKQEAREDKKEQRRQDKRTKVLLKPVTNNG